MDVLLAFSDPKQWTFCHPCFSFFIMEELSLIICRVVQGGFLKGFVCIEDVRSRKVFSL